MKRYYRAFFAALALTVLLTGSAEAAIRRKDGVTVRLGFVGDVNLDESWPTTKHLDEKGEGMSGVLSANLIELLKEFDVLMVNNEFTYSEHGEPIANKTYHFRANPERVNLLKEIGTDLVLLANNHVFDYGEEALMDTFETLEANGIPYVGAGRNLEEAVQPYYYEIYGRRIAYVAATQAEKYDYRGVIATREASESEAGVLACYDPEAFLETIREAKETSDFVVASIHWGMEYEENYRLDQTELAEKMIEAGADAVIGTHTHCLQGIEFIENAPVFYSLGNFWFNEKELDSGVAELMLHIPSDPEEPVTLEHTKFYPCIQSGLETRLPEANWEKREVWDRMEDRSGWKIVITDQGIVKY